MRSKIELGPFDTSHHYGAHLMPRAHRAAMFVSSTCYDLSQVRVDLRDSLTSLGIEPIMSEFDTFPINPDKDTVTNCVEVVKARADMFLMIVGGRYGSTNDAGKSITNLEFLEAQAKRIPKYVFVKRNILDLLPIWRANPDGDFSSAVDSISVFKFISSFRDSGEVWVFPFETAQDISSTLRTQLSYLFSEGLDLRLKLQDIQFGVDVMGPRALRILMEKPKGWEYLLFAQILNDEISALHQKRLDVELRISFGPTYQLDEVFDVTTWITGRLSDISNIIDQIGRAMNDGMERAVGKPGEPGDAQRIYHLAKRLADGYEQLLDWTLQFYRVSTPDQFKRLIELASSFSSNALKEIESYSSTLYATLAEYIANASSYPPGTFQKITLTLTSPPTDAFLDEIQRLRGS